MAQTQAYRDVQPVDARSYRKSSIPTSERPLPQPDALENEPGDFEADYTEDRRVPALAERRRQALMPLTPMPDYNPLLNVIGVFENDPEYDALVEDICEYRRQLDARENT